MEYETRFPARLIDEAELTDLVARLAKVTNMDVDAETVYIVSTNDAEFSGMLDTLADGLIRKETQRKAEGKVVLKPSGKKSALKAEKQLGLYSYRNEATGDVASKQWINKQLANDELARGTVFVNGRGERFVVTEVNAGAPFLLVKEGEQA